MLGDLIDGDTAQGLAIDHIALNDLVVCSTPHKGGNLFTENFDRTAIHTYESSHGVIASADIDLVKFGWTGTGHQDQNQGFVTTNEVGIGTALGGILATSGDQWLDTQNTPGGIDISHTFQDTTAAVGGKTAVLSFDIGKMDVNWDTGNGPVNFKTDPNAHFEFRVDGHMVAEFDATDFATANEMQHFDVDIKASDYNAGSTHTLELVDMTDPTHTNYFGFAVDSVQINDWSDLTASG